MLVQSGYQDQIDSNHPLLVLHRRSLELCHGKDSRTMKNYLSNVAKMLYHVNVRCKEKHNKTPKHSSELLATSVEPFHEFLEK